MNCYRLFLFQCGSMSVYLLQWPRASVKSPCPRSVPRFTAQWCGLIREWIWEFAPQKPSICWSDEGLKAPLLGLGITLVEETCNMGWDIESIMPCVGQAQKILKPASPTSFKVCVAECEKFIMQAVDSSSPVLDAWVMWHYFYQLSTGAVLADKPNCKWARVSLEG